MAERYDFYVHDNRKITFNLTEPIMREDSGVTDFVFHIPKILNELEVSDWQWWLVFVNAKKEKYSIALTLSDDPERPLEYNLATYTVDYAMSIKAGSVQFALEAINTGTGGAIDNEWHTLTYETKVKETLQGNQAEYAETESDVISALLIEVRNKVNQLVGGATPTPVKYKAQMTDPNAVYLYIGSEPNEHAGHWYYHNGTTFVSGGVYGAGVVDPTPTQGSSSAVSSGGVYTALAGKIAKPLTSPNGTNGQLLRTLGNGQTEWTDFATPTTEQVGAAVDNWLDEHPEATTTVQDGAVTTAKIADEAITEAKINSYFLAQLLKVTAGETVEVVADYDGLVASTADRVIVINDNSYYGSGETVTFIHSSNDLANVLPFQRTNGDYMIPEPKNGSVSSNPPTKQIGDVVGSYINKSDLSYGGEYGAFNETCNAEIDCSTFAYLVMQGIDYNHSRYEGLEANVKGQYVGGNIPRTEQSLFSSRTAFNASEIALFFACKNRLFNVDYNREHPCSQLQAGDIIFWSDPSNVRTYNRYLWIHHIAVVLHVYPESDVIQIAQAGSGGQYSVQPVGQNNVYNVCKLSLLSFTSDLADTIVTYARPDYGVIAEKPKQVIKYAEFMGDVITPTSGNRTALAKLYFKTPLDTDKLYTLSVKGDIPINSSDVSLLALYVSTDDYNIYNCQIKNIVSTDKITISFVPCENIANANYIWFAIWTPANLTPPTTKTYNVSEISIYEGLLPDIEPTLSDLSNAVTFDTSIVTVSYCFAWKEDENVHLRANVALVAAVESDGFITIGSIDLVSLPKQAFGRERFCRKGGDPRPFTLTSATGMMAVYLKSGDTGSIIIDIEL